MTEKFDFTEGAQFNPGFIGHLSMFYPTIEYLYSDMQRATNFTQKKMKFKAYNTKIQNLIESYIGFFLGCILWAACIKDLNKPVLNNICFGGEYNEEETISEVRFIKSYIQQYQKDVKYYLGKEYEIKELYTQILDEYEEFIKLNKGFCETKDTSDIKVNSTTKTLTQTEIDNILEKIAEVVETGNFTILYPLNDILFATTV